MERFRVALVCLAVLASAACTHTVAWDPILYESGPPAQMRATVSLYMAEPLQQAEHSFRAMGSGIANRWVVPYGVRIHEFAESYLSQSFSSFAEVQSPQVASGTLVDITGATYKVAGQSAHVSVEMSARDASGRVLLEKSYDAVGPSGAGGVFGGGAFAQKGMVRMSTNRALHEVFTELTTDVRGLAR